MILMLMIDSRGIDFPGAEQEGIIIMSIVLIIIVIGPGDQGQSPRRSRNEDEDN